MRRTFVCLGDAVNLAARLMSKAPPGSVYVAEAVREAGRRRVHLGAAPGPHGQGQGRADRRVSRSTGSLERASRRRTRYRAADRRPRTASSRRSRRPSHGRARGDGRVVGIAAEAGMGKSRLVAEFVRRARRRGSIVAFGECQSFGTHDELRRLARDLAHACSASMTTRPSPRRFGRSRTSSRRSTRRSSPRAPLLDAAARDHDPRQRADRGRSTRSCARRRSRRCSPTACVPARPASRSCSCSRTATGSTRSRGICSRSWPAPPTPCRCSSCSRIGPQRSPAARSASERLRAVLRDRPRRARAGTKPSS